MAELHDAAKSAAQAEAAKAGKVMDALTEPFSASLSLEGTANPDKYARIKAALEEKGFKVLAAEDAEEGTKGEATDPFLTKEGRNAVLEMLKEASTDPEKFKALLAQLQEGQSSEETEETEDTGSEEPEA